MKRDKGFPSCRILKARGLVVLTAFLCMFSGKPAEVSLDGDTKEENVLCIDCRGPLDSLNPLEGSLSAATYVYTFLYSYLCAINAQGQLEPDLGVGWTYHPATLTWDIRLRDDALFHNGVPVTSRDVEYSLDEWGKVKGTRMLSSIRSIEVPTEHSIRITLKTHDPEFLRKIAKLEIVPRPEDDEAERRDHPIGSGPFKFLYRNGREEVCLVANDRYYGGRPSLERVIVYHQPESEKSWARLLAGKTHVVDGIYPEDYEMIARYKSRFHFGLNPHERYTVLLYNTRIPLFADARVRSAITHAIDREYLARTVLRGFAMVANGAMGVDSPYHDPSVTPVPYDPRKAARLLREAGWRYGADKRYLYKNGKCFEFSVLIFRDNRLDLKVAEYIKLCLNDIGVKVHIEPLPFNDIVARYGYNTQFEAVLTELKGAYMDPEILQEIWSNRDGKCAGAGCFEDARVAGLLAKALTEEDSAAKKKLFYELDALISAIQPGAFLYHKAVLGAISQRVVLNVPFEDPNFSLRFLRNASISRERDIR